MAKKKRTKVKQDGALRNYISYFQSVMTVGIVSRANSIQSAEEEARRKFRTEDLSCGIVGQTPFEISDTELWNPDFEGYLTLDSNGHNNLSFNLNDGTRLKIAHKIGKSAESITSEDYVQFVKESLEKSLN